MELGQEGLEQRCMLRSLPQPGSLHFIRVLISQARTEGPLPATAQCPEDQSNQGEAPSLGSVGETQHHKAQLEIYPPVG